MATNASLDRLRARSRHRKSELDDRKMPGISRDLGDKMALLRVLTLVKEEDARIAVYYYVDGMAQVEIAKLLDMPERTVSTHLERFRDRARKLLQGRGDAAGETLP